MYKINYMYILYLLSKFMAPNLRALRVCQELEHIASFSARQPQSPIILFTWKLHLVCSTVSDTGIKMTRS